VTSRSDASGTTSWVYDNANRLRTKTLPGGAVLAYAYDAAGNMISATDAGGTTAYRYNKVNELDQITEASPSNRTDVFAYDADHRLTDTWTATNTGAVYDASGNVVVAPTGFASHIRRSYDTAGNLTNIRTTAASSDANASRLADISYAYTVPTGTACAGAAAGTKTDKRQRATDQLTAKTTDYCDDSAGRLTSAVTSGGPTYTYGYDKDSNRVTDAAGTHTFNAANQLTDAGTTYDADGNLTASTAFPTLTYNGIGQTTAITPAGQASVPFTYAGAGQAERTSAGPTTAQNGALGVQTETTGGATTSYVSGPGGKLFEHTPGGDFYFYFDGLGSVIGLVDATTGNQRAAYTYDPYGSNATATAVNGALPTNPWRWVGGYLDATTGLYHFGARYYDPTMGRFTQLDPVEGGSCNNYDYVCGDPVNFVDREGRSARVNCGTVTCSVYFSREDTLYLAERSNEFGLGVGAAFLAICYPFAGPGATVCGAVGLVGEFIVAQSAKRASGKEGCLKITYLNAYPYPITYVSSNTGKYCFSDFAEAYISHGNAR
jgi:RHS repeat-associated protein